MIEPEELPEYNQPQVTNISHADVQTVNAELVRMHQADAETIHAEEVELQNSAAANIHANQVSTHQSALAMVNATELNARNSAVGYAQAEKMSVSGYTGAVVAGSVDVHESLVGYMAGGDVRVENVRTGILLARTVNGNVTTMFGTREALIAGLVSGLFAGLMLLLGRTFYGRR